MNQEYRKRVKLWSLDGRSHLYTFSCFQRRSFLIRERTCIYLADAIDKAREQYRFHLWAYVFMPEHVHLLLWFPDTEHSLSAVAKSIKQSVARRAIHFLRSENPEGLSKLATGHARTPFRFWQQGPGYDRNLDNSRAVWQAVDYIHENPVKRRLVSLPEEWKWSSYLAWEHGQEAPLKIDREHFPLT